MELSNLTVNRTVITVDGLAGSGKTTLSQLLAQELGYAYFSSGIVYRTVAFVALREQVVLTDAASLGALLHRYTISLDLDRSGIGQVKLDGQILGEEIRSTEVSQATSIISQCAPLRELLKPLQHTAFLGNSLVAEGRDMGTVIFPDAPLKFFIEVPEQVRIERRLAQLKREGLLSEKDQQAAQMKIEISERDKRDQARQTAPAKAASDAIIIDNGSRPLTEVVKNMYDFAVQRGLPKARSL